MSLYVLDTDILSHFQSGDPTVCRRVLEHRPEELVVTIISVEEQLRAWFTLRHRAKKLQRIAHVYDRFTQNVRSLSRMRIVSFTEPAIRQYDSLLAMKLGVRANDLRIAAIALTESATVVTRNLSDFGRVPGLLVEDWSK